jgi:uncharacterized membrane protein YiaA
MHNSLLSILLMFLACYMFQKATPGFGLVALVFPVFAASYLVRDYVMNPILIFLFHGILGALFYFLIQDSMLRWLFVLLMIGLFTESALFVRRNGKLRPLMEVPWMALTAGFFMYLLGLYMKNTAMVRMAYRMAIVLCLLYLIMLYVEGMTGYVKTTRDVRGLPLKRILTTNSLIIFGILTAILLAVFLADRLKLDDAVIQFGKWLWKTLRIVVTLVGLLIAFIGGLFQSDTTGTTEEAQESLQELMAEDGPTSSWLELIPKLLLILLAMYVVMKIAQKVLRFFLSRRVLECDTVEIVSQKEEGTGDGKGLWERVREALSPAEQVRRLYRKRILRYGALYQPRNTSTTGDIADSIQKEAETDISQMSELYEGVRYSNAPVTRDTLRRMKELTK